VFTLGYDSGHTLSGWKSDSDLYQEGVYLWGPSGGPVRKVPFLLMFGVWKVVFWVFAFEVFQKGVEHRLGTIFQEPPTAYESR